MNSQHHSSLSSYAPPSEPLGVNEDVSLGAGDIFSMCSLICFIPWSSVLVKNHSGDDDDVSNHSNEQGFQVVATTEDKTEISKISKSDEELAAYQSVPAWKRKYIARKEANMNNSSDSSTSLGNSNHESVPSSSPRRTALEETLDRCRNIEDTSTSLHDMKDEHDKEEVSDHETGASAVPSALSGWVTFFGLGAAASSSPSTPLYSKVLETTDPDAADSVSVDSLSLSSVSSTSSAASSFDSSPSFYQKKGKMHRRQHSPSGVMDLVASE